MDTSVHTGAFNVIGISVRTTNKDSQAMSDLGKLWGRFYAEGILQKIPGRLADDVYCVYTEYESDYQGPYTAIIGCRVSALDIVPGGLQGLKIEAGDYRRFVARGMMPDAVANAWKEIWASDAELKRKYTADYEVYSPQPHDPDNPEVEIFIAI